MKYTVHVSGFFGYDCEVEATNEEEAKEKALLDFEDYDSTYLWLETEDTTIIKEEER